MVEYLADSFRSPNELSNTGEYSSSTGKSDNKALDADAVHLVHTLLS